MGIYCYICSAKQYKIYMHTAWLTHSLWVSFLVSIHMSYVMDCLAKHKRSGTFFFCRKPKNYGQCQTA